MPGRLHRWAAVSLCAAALACTRPPPGAPAAPDGGAPSRVIAPGLAPPAEPTPTPGDVVAPPAPAPGASPGPGPADVAAPPARTCGDPGLTASERARCKFEALADEGAAAADALYASSMGATLSPRQRQQVASARDRMQREKARAGDRLRTLTRRRDARCALAECDGTIYPACVVGNRDGICDPGEDCLEVIGDGIGDDLQPCAPTKGRKAEDCVVVCDDEAVCRSDDSADADLQAGLEGDLDEALGHARAMKRAIESTGRAAAVAIAALPAVEAGETACALDPQGYARWSDAAAVAMRVAEVSTRGIADVGERFCDTSVFGFNCGACCVVLESLAMVAAVANAHCEAFDAVVTSATLDAALACVAQVSATTSQSLADVKALQEGLDRVEATQDEIILLLQTPPGARPGYPSP